MATITATKAGNWSDTSVWDLGRVPQSGDDVALAGYVIVWDTSITRIPASGSLASISSTGTAGQISIALNDAAFHSGATLDVGTGNITAGTKPTVFGLLLVTGATDHVLTITGNIVGGSNANAFGLYASGSGSIILNGNATGGTGSYAQGIYADSSSPVTINGNTQGGSANASGFRNGGTGAVSISGTCTGGSGSEAFGFWNSSTGAATINGNVVGGTYYSAGGVCNTSTGQVTLGSAVSIIQGTKGAGYMGNAPAWSPASTSYAKFYVGASFGQAANTEFPQVLSAANIKAGVTSGSVTGTLASGGTLIGKGSLVG
jgi:hypothetical protein